MRDRKEIDIQWMIDIRNDGYISYNKLYMQYYRPLCLFVYGIINNYHDTEDIVQELFLHLWHDRKKIVITDNVSAYLYKVAKNMTLNHIRKEDNYKSLLEKREQPSHYEDKTLELSEFRATLYDCINRLPARSKEIFFMHRVKGLKQQEIADVLTISPKTVKNQIWLSLQKLKQCLTQKGIN